MNTLTRERFDETDRLIIDLLAHDGRITAKAMAQNLGLAEATIRNRLNRLIQSGQVRISGLINHEAFEDQVVALIALEVQSASGLESIGRQIAELPSVRNVAVVSGRYDFLVEILVDSNRGIIHFLSNELSGIEGIGKTETFLLLKSYNKWVIPN